MSTSKTPTLLILLLITLGCCHGAAVVTIDTYHIINTVEEYFNSWSMDVSLVSTNWDTFDFSSPKLHTLMKAMSPALFRVGGSPADWLVFDKPLANLNQTGVKPTLIEMTKKDWDNMVQLTRATGNRLLFDLDLQLRYGTQWDPSNALELMEYTASQGYGDNIDFELGNEPNVYYAGDHQVVLKGAEVGQSLLTLYDLMRSYDNLNGSRLVGPDVTLGMGSGAKEKEIIKGVVDVAGHVMKAITIHQYYFRGDVAKYEEYLNYKHFPDLEGAIKSAKEIIASSKNPDIPLWIGETADAWHSGTANVSDRFVSGFLWMEKLGLAASMGVDVVMRQTLYGHNYGLIDIDLNPNPDYWLSLMHKVLCGQKVLKVDYGYAQATTRLYAHCTAQGGGYPAGAVTMFGLNISPNMTEKVYLDSQFINQDVDVYLMSPPSGLTMEEGLLSKFVAVNGQVLKMVDDNTLPKVAPKRQSSNMPIIMPPLTFGYFVYPNAAVDVCK